MLDLSKLKWWGNDQRLNTRLESVCSSWLDTRYQEGQRARGIACDCRELVQGVLDELYGNKAGTKLPKIAADAAIHDPSASIPAIRAMMEANEGVDDVTHTTKTIEPGDVIAASGESFGLFRQGRQAHALIVGGVPWRVYHALPETGVTRSTVSGSGVMILRLYRPRKKHLWA